MLKVIINHISNHLKSEMSKVELLFSYFNFKILYCQIQISILIKLKKLAANDKIMIKYLFNMTISNV